jgi:hypothetical protein
LLSSANVVANMAAAPMPCTVRAMISTLGLGASPHIRDEIAKIASPAM